MVNTPSLSPALQGFTCIRCHAEFPLGIGYEGCPECATQGHPVSLAPTWRHDTCETLPILDGLHLGEGNTPLHTATELANELGLAEVYIKDEGCNPTGSHKDRLCQQIAAHAHLTGQGVIIASSGNAGLSLATYARANNVPCTVLTTASTPHPLIQPIEAEGATVEVCGSARERWTRMRERVRAGGVLPASNYLDTPVGSNPLGVQGFKAVAWEIVHALRDRFPTAVLVPTMRGDLLWGLWAGFEELRGSLPFEPPPRLVAVEPFPRIRRVLEGADYRQRFEGSTTQRSIGGTSVTWQAVAAVRDSGGEAVVVDDDTAAQAQRDLAAHGHRLEACAAAPLAAARALRASGWLTASARIVLVATAHARE